MKEERESKGGKGRRRRREGKEGGRGSGGIIIMCSIKKYTKLNRANKET